MKMGRMKGKVVNSLGEHVSSDVVEESFSLWIQMVRIRDYWELVRCGTQTVEKTSSNRFRYESRTDKRIWETICEVRLDEDVELTFLM
jgi:hypothetical protein